MVRQKTPDDAIFLSHLNYCTSNNRRQNRHIHFFNPYFVPVILFVLLACPFSPSSPQRMLCNDYCDLELSTSNIDWGSRVFHSLLCGKKSGVACIWYIKCTFEDNVSTNYVACCSFFTFSVIL